MGVLRHAPSGAPRLTSVIIPVFADWDRLHTCLDALSAQTLPPERFEVVVVDNGSPSGPRVRRPDGIETRVLVEPRAGSYAARNRGLEDARGEVLAFLDSDCIPLPDWLERGLAAMARLEGPGYVAGYVELFVADERAPTAVELEELCNGFPVEAYMTELHFGPTANLLVHHRVFDAVGPFRADVPSGADMDFGRRVHAAGFPQAYARDAVVRHPARRSLPELLSKAYRIQAGLLTHFPARDQRLRRVVAPFRPPLRRLGRILASPRAPRVADKLRAGAVALTVHYAAALENLRIRGLGRRTRYGR